MSRPCDEVRDAARDAYEDRRDAEERAEIAFAKRVGWLCVCGNEKPMSASLCAECEEFAEESNLELCLMVAPI